MLLDIAALGLFVKNSKSPSMQNEFLTKHLLIWGMDLVSPLSGVNVCCLMVMTEYLTKWAEVYTIQAIIVFKCLNKFDGKVWGMASNHNSLVIAHPCNHLRCMYPI